MAQGDFRSVNRRINNLEVLSRKTTHREKHRFADQASTARINLAARFCGQFFWGVMRGLGIDRDGNEVAFGAVRGGVVLVDGQHLDAHFTVTFQDGSTFQWFSKCQRHFGLQPNGWRSRPTLGEESTHLPSSDFCLLVPAANGGNKKREGVFYRYPTQGSPTSSCNGWAAGHITFGDESQECRILLAVS